MSTPGSIYVSGIAVEDYHQRMISKLNGMNGSDGKQGTSEKPVEDSEITDTRLLNTKKHFACAVALKELGGESKTRDVADWLLSRGYGQNLDKKVFQTSCYVAMKRRTDMFEKLDAGKWRLVEKTA